MINQHALKLRVEAGHYTHVRLVGVSALSQRVDVLALRTSMRPTCRVGLVRRAVLAIPAHAIFAFRDCQVSLAVVRLGEEPMSKAGPMVTPACRPDIRAGCVVGG